MSEARILVVEDDDVLRDLICRNLQMRHHQVFAARDAQSALEQLHTMTFDLIFLDIDLPDQTGWEVLRRARREGNLPPLTIEDQEILPVVVLSAVRLCLQRQSEFRLLAYLPKPFPMESVLRFAREAAIRQQLCSEGKQLIQADMPPAIQHEEEHYA